MDLLLAVQDFLIAWHKGKREDVEAVDHDEFRRVAQGSSPSRISIA